MADATRLQEALKKAVDPKGLDGPKINAKEAADVLAEAYGSVTPADAEKALRAAGFTDMDAARRELASRPKQEPPPTPPPPAQLLGAQPNAMALTYAQIEASKERGFMGQCWDFVVAFFTANSTETVSYGKGVSGDQRDELVAKGTKLVEETPGFLDAYQVTGKPRGEIDVETLRTNIAASLAFANRFDHKEVERRTEIMLSAALAAVPKAVEAEAKAGGPKPSAPVPQAPTVSVPLGGLVVQVPRGLVDPATIQATLQAGMSAKVPPSGVGSWEVGRFSKPDSANHPVSVEVVAKREQPAGPLTWETTLKIDGKPVPANIQSELLRDHPSALGHLYRWMQGAGLPRVTPDKLDELAHEVRDLVRGGAPPARPQPPSRHQLQNVGGAADGKPGPATNGQPNAGGNP